jgi:hypothetical protein
MVWCAIHCAPLLPQKNQPLFMGNLKRNSQKYVKILKSNYHVHGFQMAFYHMQFL